MVEIQVVFVWRAFTAWISPLEGGILTVFYTNKKKMWIYLLNSLQPADLNNECNLAVFLES